MSRHRFRAFPVRRKQSSSIIQILAIGCGVLLFCVVLCCGGLAVVGYFNDRARQNELTEANRLWDAGKETEAIPKYKSILDAKSDSIPSPSERPTVYQRIVDFDIAHGNTEAARQRIEAALADKVEIVSSKPATIELIATVRAQRDHKEADARARKEAEAKKKEEERIEEAKRKQEERERAPRNSVEIVELHIVPFRTADGVNTRIVQVDWKNTGNRPVRALWGKFTAFDGQKKQTDAFPKFDLCFYAVVANDRPGVAPGATYIAPAGEGKIILPLDNERVMSVNVKITKIEEVLAE